MTYNVKSYPNQTHIPAVICSSVPRPDCPPPPIQCYNMGHNVYGINMYGVLMIRMDNLHAGGHSDRGYHSYHTGVKEHYCPQNNTAGGGGGGNIIPVQSCRVGGGRNVPVYYCLPGTKLPPPP